jgi:HAD superfamily hydrolase (TIGR01509 family)
VIPTARRYRRPVHLAGIVFDFDGLILETEWAEYESIAAVFTDHGTVLDMELWQSFLGTTDHPHWTDILGEQLGRDVDRDGLVEARQARVRPVLEALPIQPGVTELIDAAERAGLPMAVASSSPAPWVCGHLERIGLLDRFVAVRTGDDVARTKPSPEVYELAVAAMGVDLERVVAIEDSVTGCRAARAAGLAVVAVPSTLTVGMDFTVADLVVESAADLDLGILDALVA